MGELFEKTDEKTIPVSVTIRIKTKKRLEEYKEKKGIGFLSPMIDAILTKWLDDEDKKMVKVNGN